MKTISVTFRDMKELSDYLFPIKKKEQQLGMFDDDNKRRVERDETVGVGTYGTTRQKHRQTQRVG